MHHRYNGENFFGFGLFKHSTVKVPPSPLKFESCNVGSVTRLFLDLVGLDFHDVSLDEQLVERQFLLLRSHLFDGVDEGRWRKELVDLCHFEQRVGVTFEVLQLHEPLL